MGTPGSCVGHDHSVAFKANLDVALIKNGKEKEELFDTPLDPAEPFHSEMLSHSSQEENRPLNWNIRH